MKYTDTVKAAETGAKAGDGDGTRTFSAAPKGPVRNPEAGRHNIGAPTGDPGNKRASQGPSGSVVGTGVNQKTAVPQDAPTRTQEPTPYSELWTDAANTS